MSKLLACFGRQKWQVLRRKWQKKVGLFDLVPPGAKMATFDQVLRRRCQKIRFCQSSQTRRTRWRPRVRTAAHFGSPRLFVNFEKIFTDQKK